MLLLKVNMHTLLVDLADVSAKTKTRARAAGTCGPVKKNITILDTLILQIYFLTIKLNNFRGDLSDTSAQAATLVWTPEDDAQALLLFSKLN